MDNIIYMYINNSINSRRCNGKGNNGNRYYRIQNNVRTYYIRRSNTYCKSYHRIWRSNIFNNIINNIVNSNKK